MHPLLLDAFNELDDVESEAGLLQQAMARFFSDRDQPPDELRDWLLLQGLASAVEKIYSGYESIMNRVASVVDGMPVTSAGNWHVVLLRRMARPVPDVRPALISSATFDTLDTLRAFRHRERNTYGSNLTLNRTLANAEVVGRLVPMFRADLTALAHTLS